MNAISHVTSNKYLRLAYVGGLIIFLDQFTKMLVLKGLPLYHSVTVIPGFFNLTHIHNPGGAFGFLAGQDEMLRSMIFVFVSTLAICFILYFYLKTAPTHFWLATGLAMIFGGAIGNLIDRIRFGKVVDFLDFYIGRLHWPAFNVADSAITIGILIFLFHVVFNRLPDSD